MGNGKELTKVIGTILISLAMLVGATYIMFKIPEYREAAFGMYGLIGGYWLR